MKRILIIGGYGHVGQKIARRLRAAGRPVTIAGRDGAQAGAVARRLGCEGAALDLHRLESWPESWDVPLAGVDTVICCLDTPDTRFARAVLERGLRYIDISATDAVLRRVETLDTLARERDTLALLSVGLAPGLSNLMVRAARDRHPAATKFRIGVLLGLGDSHGPAAIDWTLRSLSPLPRGTIQPLRFGADRRALPSIPFDFADQHALMRRGYPQVETRLTLASPLMTAPTLRLLGWMAGRSSLRRTLARVMPYLRLGPDRAALLVEACAEGRPAPLCRLTLEGRQEAEITALIAAETALRITGMPERGVRHLDEVLRLEDLRKALNAEGIVVEGDRG